MIGPSAFRLVASHFRELYRSRALVANLVHREVVARYKRSVFGFLWTLLNPLMSLAVYALVFTQITSSVSMPNYGVFAFTGLLPWTWLSAAVLQGATSIIGGGALVTKICIPPQVLPAVVVLTHMVNCLFALPIAILAAWACGLPPGPALLVLPLLIGVQLVFCYSVAVLLAALSVHFRDVPFILQNLVVLWFFLTPIVYPLHSVPARLQPIYAANPATSVILPFVDVVYYSRLPSASMVASSTAWSLVLLFIGIVTFESLRNLFAQEV